MLDELRKLLKDELQTIKETALTKRSKCLRYGQDVFNKCYMKFPHSVNTLRGTEYDCFYKDDKVDLFLEKLEKTIIEKILE